MGSGPDEGSGVVWADVEIQGTYPMLYAFFDDEGQLRRDAFTRQIDAGVASGASGIAVLGLGTEGGKLGLSERRQVVDWVLADVAGRLPVAVTIADGNVPDMIESARYAQDKGAAWLILQPPRPPASGPDLMAFFGAVAQSVSCPVAIQNAPDLLGIGLSPEELLSLNAAHPNITLAKAESPAVTIAALIETLGGRMRVLNGRAGLELTDNYRAGVHGMIPGIETVDFQVRVQKAMAEGNEAEAEAIYRTVLPTLCFIFQTLPHFVLYGKLIAALRLGIEPGIMRTPSDKLTNSGQRWAQRLATELGPLPY